MSKVTNIVIAGLGGQGVLKCSDIIADVAFAAGIDVKKSELHGMSQRGGSVSSDVRFGPVVFSPMVPEGEADFLVAIAADQVPVNASVMKPGATLIEPANIEESKVRNKKALNVALLGALSRHLDFTEQQWLEAIRRNLPENLHEANMQAFAVGRGA